MNFDDIEIDAEKFEVRRAGQPVPVEPKVFDLLYFLATNPNRLITKDELIGAVWSGRIVSDAAMSTAIKFARRAVGDKTAESRIKTVRGRGFRFEIGDDGAAQAETSFKEPAFAILPIAGSADPARDFDVVVRRVLSTISHLPYLRVIAPTSFHDLADASPSAISKKIGEGFLLEIAPCASSEGEVFDCTLSRTGTGETVWMFQVGPLVQASDEEIASAIGVQLEPQLLRALRQGLEGVTDPRALALRAMGTMSLKGWNKTAFTEAEVGLKAALAADPDLAFARGALALVMALGQRIGLTEPDPARLKEAIANAEKAIELDGLSPLILGHAGCALVDAGQHLRGRSVLDRALSLDPMNAQALAAMGTVRMMDRDFQGAAKQLARAVSISPNDSRLAIWRSVLAMAYLKVDDISAAIIEAQKAVAADDRTHMSRIILAHVLLKAERLADARAAWEDAVRVTEDLSQHHIVAVIGRKNANALRQAFAD